MRGFRWPALQHNIIISCRCPHVCHIHVYCHRRDATSSATDTSRRTSSTSRGRGSAHCPSTQSGSREWARGEGWRWRLVRAGASPGRRCPRPRGRPRRRAPRQWIALEYSTAVARGAVYARRGFAFRNTSYIAPCIRTRAVASGTLYVALERDRWLTTVLRAGLAVVADSESHRGKAPTTSRCRRAWARAASRHRPCRAQCSAGRTRRGSARPARHTYACSRIAGGGAVEEVAGQWRRWRGAGGEDGERNWRARRAPCATRRPQCPPALRSGVGGPPAESPTPSPHTRARVATPRGLCTWRESRLVAPGFHQSTVMYVPSDCTVCMYISERM